MKRRRESSIGDLVAVTLRGNLRSASRLIRIIDDGNPNAWEALKQLFPQCGRALVVGITGPPGASNTVNVIFGHVRQFVIHNVG